MHPSIQPFINSSSIYLSSYQGSSHSHLEEIVIVSYWPEHGFGFGPTGIWTGKLLAVRWWCYHYPHPPGFLTPWVVKFININMIFWLITTSTASSQVFSSVFRCSSAAPQSDFRSQPGSPSTHFPPRSVNGIKGLVLGRSVSSGESGRAPSLSHGSAHDPVPSPWWLLKAVEWERRGASEGRDPEERVEVDTQKSWEREGVRGRKRREGGLG